MQSQLVYKGIKSQREAYVPGQINSATREVKQKYFSIEVQEIIALREIREGKKLCTAKKRELYATVGQLMERSEARKQEIIEEHRQRMSQYPEEVLGFRKQGNKTIRLNQQKADELVHDMAQVHRLIEAAFAQRTRIAYDRIPRKIQTV